MRLLPTVTLVAACARSAPELGDALDGAPVEVDAPAVDARPAPELPAFCAELPPADLGGVAQSAHVRYGADGLLAYTADADGNRLPDVGHAGYRGGAVPLPAIAEVARLGPGDGDDTARIQAALDEIAARPLAARGALVLEPGVSATLDVPIHNHLDGALARSPIYAVDDSMLVREAAVERLRVDIVTAGGIDENHAWTAIEVAGAEDAWVDDVTALHFGYAGVRVHDSDRITVRDARALDPVAEVTGGRIYNFSADSFAQEILFTGCEASLSRHAFVSNGTSSVSGVVFHRSTARDSRNSSEGHRRWSQALVYDNITEVSPDAGTVVGLYNRGDWGTQHGWAAAHSVLWRYDTGGRRAVLQRPPTAQNYAIATTGTVTADGPFAGPPGAAEPIAGTLAPASLYEAQVCDRLRRGL